MSSRRLQPTRTRECYLPAAPTASPAQSTREPDHQHASSPPLGPSSPSRPSRTSRCSLPLRRHTWPPPPPRATWRCGIGGGRLGPPTAAPQPRHQEAEAEEAEEAAEAAVDLELVVTASTRLHLIGRCYPRSLSIRISHASHQAHVCLTRTRTPHTPSPMPHALEPRTHPLPTVTHPQPISNGEIVSRLRAGNQFIKLFDVSALRDGAQAKEVTKPDPNLTRPPQYFDRFSHHLTPSHTSSRLLPPFPQVHSIRYFDGFLGARIGPVTALAFHPTRMLLAVGATDSVLSVYSDTKAG